METSHSPKLITDALIVLRGFLMGAADIIPGVSGGTVALVVGIYQRLITAISRVDGHFLGLVLRRNWSGAWSYVDGRFLLSLLLGIVVGIVSLGSILEELLVHATFRALTLAAFFGMIVASSWIVARMIRPRTQGQLVQAAIIIALSGVAAFWLTGLPQIGSSSGPLYLFFCGMIAICAMILPGVSGAYVLVILGAYPQITDILHRLKHGQVDLLADGITLVSVASGCALGIILFSKFLCWLLADYERPTMAALTGLMLGALRKIWPLQIDTTPGVEKLKEKVFVNYLPQEWDAQVTWCLISAAVAIALVLLLDRVSHSARDLASDAASPQVASRTNA